MQGYLVDNGSYITCVRAEIHLQAKLENRRNIRCHRTNQSLAKGIGCCCFERDTVRQSLRRRGSFCKLWSKQQSRVTDDANRSVTRTIYRRPQRLPVDT